MQVGYNRNHTKLCIPSYIYNIKSHNHRLLFSVLFCFFGWGQFSRLAPASIQAKVLIIMFLYVIVFTVTIVSGWGRCLVLVSWSMTAVVQLDWSKGCYSTQVIPFVLWYYTASSCEHPFC